MFMGTLGVGWGNIKNFLWLDGNFAVLLEIIEKFSGIHERFCGGLGLKT